METIKLKRPDASCNKNKIHFINQAEPFFSLEPKKFRHLIIFGDNRIMTILYSGTLYSARKRFELLVDIVGDNSVVGLMSFGAALVAIIIKHSYCIDDALERYQLCITP